MVVRCVLPMDAPTAEKLGRFGARLLPRRIRRLLVGIDLWRSGTRAPMRR